jgi:ATP-dependent Lhr-like helicase
VLVSRANANDPKSRPMPAASSRSRPISPNEVSAMLDDPRDWARCRRRCATGSPCSDVSRAAQARDELLVETFPRGGRIYLVAYPFEGRLAHQTLGMLLTRRLERAGAPKPLGFVATDYALVSGRSAIIGARSPRTAKLSLDALFDEDMLGDDLEEWLAESSLMKRTFRSCAVIAGLDRAAPSRQGEDPAGR